MTTYKTTAGLTKACEALIAEMESSTIDNPHDESVYSDRVSSLLRQCNALWSNPADVEDFAKLANRLNDAWHKATH